MPGVGLKSADQALRAPHARPLSSLEKSYSIAREMPAVPWSCRIRRTRILLLFSTNLERFARLYSLRRHTRVNKRHAGWSRENSERNCCLHLSTSGAARGGPDRDRQRAARPCRWFRHDRNGYNPGQQGRRERNALAKRHPTRDELLRINRWSFGAVRLHSGLFVSVTAKAAIS